MAKNVYLSSITLRSDEPLIDWQGRHLHDFFFTTFSFRVTPSFYVSADAEE